jgi:hypothetical protein
MLLTFNKKVIAGNKKKNNNVGWHSLTLEKPSYIS